MRAAAGGGERVTGPAAAGAGARPHYFERHYRLSSAASWATARAAFSATRSAGSPPSGWSITRSGRSSIPSVWASWCAKGSNAVVVTTAAGVPDRSSRTASWRLHDVHDPQSAEPVTTKSTPASAASTSGGAGVAAFTFRA